MIKTCLEKRLLESNSLPNGQHIPFANLPVHFVLNLQLADKEVISNFTRDIEEFVNYSNMYYKHKCLEDQAKVSFL